MRPVCRIAMCVIVMIVAVTSVFAQKNRGARSAVTTKDHKMTFVSPAPRSENTPYVDANAGLKPIFSNLAVAYPKGLYWCCEGATISGPKTPPLNIEWWHAAAFTPATDATAKAVVVALGYLSGNDQTVILSLNADNGGIPGTTLEYWYVNNLSEAGTCCMVQSKSSSGIALTAGQQYWVVVSTGPNSDINASWNLADNDQIDLFLNAGYTNQNSNGWVDFMTNQNVAFGVYGQ